MKPGKKSNYYITKTLIKTIARPKSQMQIFNLYLLRLHLPQIPIQNISVD